MAHKILIVDDEENQRKLYAQVFEEEGYTVIEADSGRSALEKLTKEHPDLVILDICMPGMDGMEALGKMLSSDERVPIILNTAYGVYKDNFMSWAADAYVVKSADFTELKKKVKELLAERAGS